MVNVAWAVLHRNRHIGAREWKQLIPHVRFQVPFLGPESQLKSGFACGGLLCQYVLRPRRGLGQASPSLEAPLSRTGLLPVACYMVLRHHVTGAMANI